MNQIIKTETHIVKFSDVDQTLAIALGEMVVAYGRLEDMFKVVIKRKENRQLEEVVNTFMGRKGMLGDLIVYCTKFGGLQPSCDLAKDLNDQRHDFIHATFGIEKGQYVRFRKLVGHADLQKDIDDIKTLTAKVYEVINELDRQTATTPPPVNGVVDVSVAGNI